MSIKNFLFGSLLVSLFMTGCGGAASTDRPDFVPVQPDPTATATSISGGAQPDRTPTSVVSDQVSISNYSHPSGRFTINYPENWQPFERSDGVVFIDPGNQAGYSVVITDVGERYSDQELNQFLVTFVAKNFADKESNFSAISQESKADGSVVAQFSSLDPNLGQAINEVRVWQQDTIVFVVLISATEEQWQLSHPKLQKLADTLTPLDTSPIVGPTPTTEPPPWILIGPTSNQFGFLYPSNWEVVQQDETQVVVTMPGYDVTFEGKINEWAKAKEQEDPVAAAEQAALAHLELHAEEYKDVENLTPTEFPLDQITGITVDFLYTNQDGAKMAGSIITAAREENIYRVTFTAPAEMYEAALQWFNPMYKSFKVLSPEDIILSDQ